MAVPIITTTKTLEKNSASVYDVTLSNGEFKLASTRDPIKGVSAYYMDGFIEFSIVDLGQTFKAIKTINVENIIPVGTSVKIYTSTSSDFISFSPLVEINSDRTINSPQARYIKIKVEFIGAEENVSYTANDFTGVEESEFSSSIPFVMNGELSVKREYEEVLVEDLAYSGEGRVFSAQIYLENFKRINKVSIE